MRLLILLLCGVVVAGLVYAQETTDSSDTSSVYLAEPELPDSLLAINYDTGIFVGFFLSDMVEATFTKGLDTVYYACASENTACFLANNVYSEVVIQVETWRTFLYWVEENETIDFVTIVQVGDATSENTAVPDEPLTAEDTLAVNYCDSLIKSLEIGSW